MSYRVNIAYEKNMPSTQNLVSVIARRVGRKKRWAENMQARFPEGTFERIEAVLKKGEDRTDLVRVAVERELKRREKARTRIEDGE